jgi:hypothetical protein
MSTLLTVSTRNRCYVATMSVILTSMLLGVALSPTVVISSPYELKKGGIMTSQK